MRFRLHRATLSESMPTTVYIEPTREALHAEIERTWADGKAPSAKSIRLEYQGHDDRISWDTYLVTAYVGTVPDGEREVIGMTDGPLVGR